jgi:hypothetical protein|tara:strand:- start:4494 stop:4661 length:168 start_codon:yes stop_codon:yes gene_type:complete
LAAAAIPLLENFPDAEPMQTLSKTSQATTPRLSVPASTISGNALIKPAQAQRWVF